MTPPPPHTNDGVRWPVLAACLVVLFGAPPLIAALVSDAHAPQGWLLAALAQAATMIVFALSYNLLLGETGLLSFGHAAPAGLGALFAAQCFNHHPFALPLLPLVGGIGGAAFGVLTAAIAARRAGTAFAMITLGIGELVAAAAWALPDWFGGDAGVAIDRASGPALGGSTFGPDREAYCLIAAWCVLASVAMLALTRTPAARLANAVRDNPVRAAALGCSPARTRAAMIVWGGFFAGVAGTLALINVELAAAESVGIARSASVLIATVTGGAASFVGPMLGALVWVAFSVGVASVTRAWMLYVGLFFVAVVLVAPDGLAGLALRQRRLLARFGWRRCAVPWAWALLATAAALAALVPAVQWVYAVRFGADEGDMGVAFAASASAPHRVWAWAAAIVACIVVAVFGARRALAARRSLEAAGDAR
jgi:branched-chain amino acid transport system permease protein